MGALREWIDGRRRRLTPLSLGSGFGALFDCEFLGLALLSPTGRFLATNRPLERMLGYGARELAGLTFDQVTYPEDIPACGREFGRLQRGEIENFELEKRYLRKDGSLMWAHIVVAAVRRRGRLLHTVGAAVDITRRKAAEEAVCAMKGELEERVRERTSELVYQTALFAAVQEASPDGIAVVDHDSGRLLSCNTRFIEMWGIPDEIALSGSLDRVVAYILPQLTEPEKALAAMNQLGARRHRRALREMPLKDGRIFEFYSRPVTSAGGASYGRVSYWRDVTRRARAELELREKSDQLSRSNADLDTFASAVAHDLVSPLRKIIAFGDLLRMRLKDGLDEESADLLARLQAGALGMARLIAQVLELSRIGRERLSPEEVDLSRLAADVAAVLRPEIDEVRGRVETGPLPTVRAHSSLLRRVLQNLIANALKFHRPDVPPLVRVESRVVPDGVEISVADNGIGFAPEDAEKVFEPFVRLHSAAAYPGSGIGLAICRRVAERYGGSMTVASEPGKGSVFTLRLPAEMLVARPG